MIRKLFLFAITTTLLFAKYTNCEFQNEHYIEICKKAKKRGVPVHTINTFLLSKKTKELDLLSFKFFNKKQIARHRENEKKANNALIKYIPTIVKHVKKYKKVYDKAEKKYGVNREIVASILMKETKLGKIKPTFDAFKVFNTLVVKVDPKTRRDRWLLNMGKTNMVSIIEYCYKKKLNVNECILPSSYAGAVGIPQFMPNSFIYADSYKNKVADLTKMEDAIMSASKFLHKKASFKTLIDWKQMPDIPKTEQTWYDYAYEHKNASLVYEKNKKTDRRYKCFTCNKKEFKYLRDYAKKVMRYNNSSNYAIGVIRLAHDTHKQLG